ncbi:hypothetical protein SAMN06314019_1105 [Epsilonproteobacteria bacterium SCGC AD-311-C15]|jgi:hypothetical protein|nr:hypothetical protein SAMN06314019_1105 [Epsilonproteobacteria bacterium SCGC AD-311-C15]
MNGNLSKQQQKSIYEMFDHTIERPKRIAKMIDEILCRKHLAHGYLAFHISTEEAKQLFPEMEIYRDYENGAQGLVLSMSELEEEPEMSYCVEEIALRTWVPFQGV